MAIYNESVNNSYILARITKTGWAPDIRGDLWDVNSISNDISSKARKYFGPVDIQKLHIKIVDKYGRVVDLRNGFFDGIKVGVFVRVNFLCYSIYELFDNNRPKISSSEYKK